MVKYPIPKTSTQNTIFKSRGMVFENELNKSNEYYLNANIAVIYKKPTPIRIVKVEYPSRSHAKIVEAYYQTPSTTDYNGVYRGKYIDFEAKETQNNSFSFSHIFPHQVEHLLKVNKHGGIAFVIIYFKKLDKIYLIDIIDFYKLYSNGLKGGKKSVSYNEIEADGGLLVSRSFTPLIDYIKQVDELYFEN